MRWRIRWRGGKKVGGYFRSRRRTDLFVALPRTSGTVRAWHKPSTEESLYYVNTTGVLVTGNIGLVQRLMTRPTLLVAAMVGGGERIADAESARPCTGIGVCTIVRDPIRINTPRTGRDRQITIADGIDMAERHREGFWRDERGVVGVD